MAIVSGNTDAKKHAAHALPCRIRSEGWFKSVFREEQSHILVCNNVCVFFLINVELKVTANFYFYK